MSLMIPFTQFYLRRKPFVCIGFNGRKLKNDILSFGGYKSVFFRQNPSGRTVRKYPSHTLRIATNPPWIVYGRFVAIRVYGRCVPVEYHQRVDFTSFCRTGPLPVVTSKI